MAIYAWPFPVNRFEMRILPNTRIFTGPYTPTTQVLDLLGERWIISLDIPPTDDTLQTVAAREAFFDRLKGPANWISMGHQMIKAPLGTFGAGVPVTWRNSSAATVTWRNSSSQVVTWTAGDPVTVGDIQQLASTAVIRNPVGRTLLAGSLLGIGGQLVRIMADTVADSNGNMPIEFQPRMRQFVPNGTSIVYSAPTANFILKPGTPNVPTSWTPGMADGATIELIEVF
jgi:hypothetical protein